VEPNSAGGAWELRFRARAHKHQLRYTGGRGKSRVTDTQKKGWGGGKQVMKKLGPSANQKHKKLSHRRGGTSKMSRTRIVVEHEIG